MSSYVLLLVFEMRFLGWLDCPQLTQPAPFVSFSRSHSGTLHIAFISAIELSGIALSPLPLFVGPRYPRDRGEIVWVEDQGC